MMKEEFACEIGDQMGKLKSTIHLFLAAFEANNYPADSIEAMYVLQDQAESLAAVLGVGCTVD